jgi:predicted signal transduction protein with EAL and GGDEF domain
MPSTAGAAYAAPSLSSPMSAPARTAQPRILMARTTSSARLVQTIVHLANDLGLGTVAEGAQKVEQGEVLRSLGCHLVQGYYFSKPVPVADLERLLKNGIEVNASVG